MDGGDFIYGNIFYHIKVKTLNKYDFSQYFADQVEKDWQESREVHDESQRGGQGPSVST